jgi:hypothetical protein
MARGKSSRPGETRVSPNGYQYTRTDGRGWQLTHRIVAEKKLGRPLHANERVRFQDGDRTNLSQENIIVYEKRVTSNGTRRARLEAKIAELQAELDGLDEEM